MKSAWTFVLDQRGEPKPESDWMTWAFWFGSSHKARCVACKRRGFLVVSTVFLGLNYGWNNRRPILWETAVFDRDGVIHLERCGGNREQAEAMHAEVCRNFLPARRKASKQTLTKKP